MSPGTVGSWSHPAGGAGAERGWVAAGLCSPASWCQETSWGARGLWGQCRGHNRPLGAQGELWGQCGSDKGPPWGTRGLWGQHRGDQGSPWGTGVAMGTV